MTEMKTASFRIDREKWDEFIAKAEANGFTGTKVIQDAIDRYIAGTYPEIEKQQRQHRSVTVRREELTALTGQLAAAVVQIERLASQVAELQGDKKNAGEHLAPQQK
jgi:putative protein kinase ArgK-like GTPase of G3E family